MAESTPSVALPVIPGFCNVAVFPSPQKNCHESRFFLLNNSAALPVWSSKVFMVEHIPGSIYCLFPSTEDSQWNMCYYPIRPSFIQKYSYCMEINKAALVFSKLSSDSMQLDEKSDTKVIAEV